MCVVCVCMWSFFVGGSMCVVCVYVCVCVFSFCGEGSVCGSVGLYISVPYNLVESLKCYTLNYLKDVIF